MNPTINMVKWSKVRILAKDRDKWSCVKCGKAGRLEVDHIKPVALGGAKYDLANLQTLDRGCHIAKSAAERRAARPVDPRIQAWRDLISSRIDAMV